MQKATLPLLCLVFTILLGGCTTGGTPPLTSAPPAPYLIVPKPFFAVADNNSRTSELRRTPLASSSSRIGERKPIACFNSAFVNGAVSAAIVEEADQGAQYATQYHTRVGTQLPAGKYLPVGQDHLGFFYQAPMTFFVDESNLVTGGIYWRNATSGPGGIWYQWGSHNRPCVTYNRDVKNEVIVPRGH